MKYDIFSKRGKSPPDVYVFDDIPWRLRVQLILIWDRLLVQLPTESYVYNDLVHILRLEYGVFSLGELNSYSDDREEIHTFFLYEEDHERVLDVIELSFRWLSDWASKLAPDIRENATALVDNATSEANDRLREHGIGYELHHRHMIRKDCEYTHAKVIVPALVLLHRADFRGASEEFLQAHTHYRKGDHKAALNECLKSLESVMKTICNKRNWDYSPNPTANPLIDTCLSNGLIPKYWQSHFRALVSLLKCGVPTGRNQLSGHGQGQAPIPVPDQIVRFMLHQTAACIVFLGESDSKL